MNNFKSSIEWNIARHQAHKVGSYLNCLGISKTHGGIAKQIEDYAKLQENAELLTGLLAKLEMALLQV